MEHQHHRPIRFQWGDRVLVPAGGAPTRLIHLPCADEGGEPLTWAIELSGDLGGVGFGVPVYNIVVGIGRMIYRWNAQPAGAYIVGGHSLEVEAVANPPLPVSCAGWAYRCAAAPTLIP